MASEVAHEQLAKAQLELKKSRVHEEFWRLREEGVTPELETAQTRIQMLEIALEAWVQSKEGWWAAFLLSSDFKLVMSDKPYTYFETDFDKEDFPSFNKAIATLP